MTWKLPVYFYRYLLSLPLFFPPGLQEGHEQRTKQENQQHNLHCAERLFLLHIVSSLEASSGYNH